MNMSKKFGPAPGEGKKLDPAAGEFVPGAAKMEKDLEVTM
jgi:hypothetical protein